MIRDVTNQRDGMVSFTGGQQAGVAPNLIADDQSAELWNCTRRSGHLKPRPGWFRIELEYRSDENESWFARGKVQGIRIFNRYGTDEVKHIWSVSGRFFAVELNAGSTANAALVTEITPTKLTSVAITFTVPNVGDTVVVTVVDADLIQVGYPIKIGGLTYDVTAKSGSTITVENIGEATPAANVLAGVPVEYLDVNDPNADVVYMIQAEDFLIAQDGKSRPFIYDGSVSRRSDTAALEIPTGTVMAYGRGRIWVAIAKGKFVGSDILYGPSGTAAYDRRDAILKFTENTFLNGGGAFSVPGEITAMAFATTLDTSTGQGPLLVFTKEAVVSVSTPTSRDAWAITEDPIQGISLVANGATGFYSTIPTINGDIFYRALDGVRSFFSAIREFGNWGNTPISREISNLIASDDKNALNRCSAIFFDNRILFTGSSRTASTTSFGQILYWRGLGALDFDGITSMFSKSPPAWEGTWTGVNIQWIYSGKYKNEERAFMAVRNQGNRSELWEISRNHKFDNQSREGTGRIKWSWYSRAFRFDTPLEMKRLHNCEVFPRDVTGEVDITLKYRPDDYPCWFDWMAQPVCADYRACGQLSCDNPPKNLRPGYKTRIPFGQPPDTDELADGKPARCGYTHQLQMVIEGYCEIKFVLLKAAIINEDSDAVVDQNETCQEIECCPVDNFEWRSDGANDPGGDNS